MNNGEAHDANTVLDYFLRLPRSGGPVHIDAAKRAAIRLAERSYKQLSANNRAAAVAEAFDSIASVLARVDEALGPAVPTHEAENTVITANLLRPVTPDMTETDGER